MSNIPSTFKQEWEAKKLLKRAKKKAKHHHTTGIFRKARECANWGPFALRSAVWVKIASLFHTNKANMPRNTQAAAT